MTIAELVAGRAWRSRPGHWMFNAALGGLTGLLIAGSFLPCSLTYLGFIALVPLLIAVRHSGRGQAFFQGWWSGCVLYAGTCFWVLPAIARFQHGSELYAIPAFAGFVVYQSLQFALFAVGVQAVAKRSPAFPVAFVASWWVVLEWLFPRVIPWHFGNALAGAPLLRQGVDICGVYGLTFLIVFVNASLAAAVIPANMPVRLRLHVLGTALVALLFATAYGIVRTHGHDTTNASGGQPAGGSGSPEHGTRDDLTIAIVQGGLWSGRTDIVIANREALKTYLDLTEPLAALPVEGEHREGSRADAGSKPDLIVWPETVLRVYLREDPAYQDRVLSLVQKLDRPLFIGSLDRPPAGLGEFNSAYLISPGLPNAAAMEVYHKLTLLPFGEYVPGAEFLPILRHWQTTGRFLAGDPVESPRLTVAKTRQTSTTTDDRIAFAPSICFEAIWPGAFNHAVKNGAALLINLTDDGWFGTSAEHYQHLQAVRLRAVETRRWLVRASNSGVSAFIDPMGNIVDSLPTGAVGLLRHTVGCSQRIPAYVRLGDWPILSLALLFIAGTWLSLSL